MKKILVSFLLMAGLGLATTNSSFATVTITNANATISADTTGGAYTTLTGPVIVEGAHQDIGAGTIILSAPAGFQFNPAATVLVSTSRVFGTLALITLSSGTAVVTPSNITITVVAPDGGSTTETALTWSGIQVRPIAGTPLATNNMIMATASTANIAGVTKGTTIFGTLKEVAGTGKKLIYTTPPAATNTAGSAMASIVVQIQDQFGNSVSSNAVPINVALNTGTFASGTTNVNSSAGGSATFSNLVINLAGSYTLTASAPTTSLTPTAGSAFTVIPAAAGIVAFVQGPPSPATAGVTFSPAVTVKVTDAFNNAITNKAVTMALRGGGTLNGTSSQPTTGSGVATFGDLSINVAATNKALIASITSPTLIVTGTAFNVNAAAGTKLVYTTAPAATNTAGATMASVVVQVQDQFNNPVPTNGVPITVALNAGAFDSGTVTVNTGAGGSSTFNNLVINTAGSYTLTASADSLTSTTPSSFTVIPAAANIITFIQSPPSTATAGVTFSPAVTVKLTDAFNNLITNKSVAMTLIGGGTLNGTTPQSTATNGIATFSNLSINAAGTNYALIASITSPTLSVTSTPPFTVVAAAPTKLVYTTAPASTNIAGTTMASVVVQVADPFGNKVASNNVSVTVALNTGTFASGTTTIATDAGGAASFSDLVINTAGNYTLTVSGAPFTATPASAFTVIPTTASSVAFVQEPPVSVSAGTTFSPAVTVKVTDQFNNVISNKAVAMTLNGGGTLNGTLSQNTAGSGVATFGNLSVNQPGSNKTLAASITSPALSATSTEFIVNIGAIDHYVVSVVGAPARTAAFNVSVTAQDVASNTVVADSSTIVTMSGTGSMQFDSNGDSVFGDNTKQLSSGTSTISAMDIYGETVTITATDGNGKTGSTSVTVNAAAGDYRSAATGNWNAIATWQVWNGAAWVAASTTPAGGAGTNITVQSAHTVTDNVGVGLGGTLIEQGVLSFSGSGVLTVGAGGLLQNAGTVNGSTSALILNAGGTYQHTRNSGTIPTATWNANSTCLISGVTSTVPGGLGQAFANFTWNCPGQTGTLNLAGGLTTVNGNFTFISSGSGILELSGTLQRVNLAIGGNFSQTGGVLYLSNGNDLSHAQSITVAKGFSLSGGTLEMSPLNFLGTGDTVSFSVGGNFSHTGGTLTETGAGSSKTITFNGTTPQTYTSGGTVANTINFTINSGATLLMGTSLLGNGSSGTFTLLAGGTLGIGDPLGITTSGASGNIRVTGTRSYNIGASYIYNGPASQVTGNGLPATVSSLTISNTGGVVTLGSNVTVSNNLTIANGTFSLGTFTANRATSGGTLAVANGATLKIGGTNPLPSNYATHSLAASSTIEYGGSAQNVSAESYGNLTLSGSGTKTLLSGSTAIADNLTIGSGTTFAAGANNFSLAGNWSNNGVGFTFSGAQTVTFNGASPQSIDGSSSTTFNDVAINSGSVLNLAFSGSDAAQVLKIAGVNKAAGTWGATGSSATHVDDAHFQGTTGVLSIATGPASATSVATSGTPSTHGTPVTFTATVTGTGPTPSGTVTFMDGINTLGVGTLDGGGLATFTTNRLSVTSHSITAVYGGDGNFAGSTSTALSQVINAATLTVSGITASNKVYDGNTTVIFDVSSAALVGVVAGDDVTLNTGGATAVFADQNAGPAKTVQVSGLTDSGADIGNYTLTQPTTTASISAYPLTVTAATNTKTYNAGTSAAATPTITLGILQGTDTAILSETYDNKNVGTGKTLTPAAAINDGNGGSNYTVTYVTDTTGEITKHSLTVTATGVNRPYDGTIVATVTLADDHLGGDSLSDSYTSASFTSADVGNSKAVTVTDVSVSGSDAGNYELTSTTAGTTANILPVSLNVVADDKSRPYGLDNPTLTKHYTGFVNSENESVLTGSPDLSTTALTNSLPGSYPISVTNGTLSAVNYTFHFVDGTLTVGKVLLTVTADDQSRPYGATNPVFTVTYTGFLNGDDTNVLFGLPDVTTTADTNSVVADSPFIISVTNGTLTATNYDFAFVSGSLTVTPAVVTITADNQSKVYGAAVPTLTASYTGFANGEGTNVLSGTPDLSTDVTANSPVANSPYTIIVTNGTLTADNYTFTFVNGSLAVTPATVTGSVTVSNKVYDATADATISSYSLDGAINGDDVTLTGGSASFFDKNVGISKPVSITGLGLSGTNAGNYSLSSSSASANATISARPLVVSATGVNKPYDGTTAATVTLSDDRVLGDIFTDSYTSALFADKNAGPAKPIAVTGIALDGTDAGNYSANTTADASANITALALDGSITAGDKVYDGTNTATITSYALSGTVISNDVVSLTGGSATFDDKNVGNTKPVTATGLTLTGADALNYGLNSSSASTTANIIPAGLTVTADNKSRPYTQINPPLTASFTGFASGDDTNNALSGTPDLSTTALTNSLPGTYPIIVTNGTLTAVNYTLNFVDGTLTVGKALLTVTADDQSRPYGATNPVFTVTYTGFLNGDDTNALSGLPAVTTDADTNSTVVDGPYTISVTNGTLTATNYDFAFVSGSLTVTPAVVTVTADNLSTVYGAALPTLTASFTGFVNGEDTNVLSGAPDLSTDATATSPVANSPYTVTVTNGTLSAANYSFAFVNGTLSMTAAQVTGSVTVSNKVYDATTDASISGYSLSGSINGDDVALTGGSASFQDKNVGTAKPVNITGLGLSGTNASNYALTSTSASTNASISQRPLTVSATGVNKPYDGTTTAAVTLSDDRIFGDSLTPTYSSALFVDKNAGPAKPITVTGIALTGTDAGNYTANTTAGASANITALALDGSITAGDKVYDGTNSATISSYALSGSIISNDVVSLTGGSATFDDKNVGNTKPVTATGLTLTGADALNYSLNSSTASTTASITPADLTVTADNKSKTQGLPNPLLTASYSGFVGGDDTNALTTPVSLSTTAAAGSPAGTYPITASGAAAVNYTIGYADGTLTVSVVPQLGVTKSGNQLILTCPGPTLTNQTYQFESKDDLGEATWTPLGDPTTGTGTSITFTNQITGRKGFFRVEIAPE